MVSECAVSRPSKSCVMDSNLISHSRHSLLSGMGGKQLG